MPFHELRVRFLNADIGEIHRQYEKGIIPFFSWLDQAMDRGECIHELFIFPDLILDFSEQIEVLANV